MLKLIIKPKEFYDESKGTFIYFPQKETELQLEHSLVSISKWEAKWHKPFLSTEEKTNEELLDYIRCMTLNSHVDPMVYSVLDSQQVKEIEQYINDPMTATTFSNDEKKGLKKIITNEVIYYMMVSFNIPFECQKWHINRLMTLIRVCAEKNAPPKKMSAKEVMNRNRALNKARRAQLHSRG